MRVARALPFVLAIPFFLLLSSCATLFPSRIEREPLSQLTKELDAILADSLFRRARAGVKIVSLSNGETLYEKESRSLFHPASNLKLITTATALLTLGTNYKFKTALYLDSLDTTGNVVGDLYLKGFGNPDFTLGDLHWMARQLKAIGVKRITGNVVGDASFFDTLFWGKGWMWDDEPSFYEAFISPLTINDNCAKVVVEPGLTIGEPVRVTVIPATGYLSVMNHAATGADTAEQTVGVTRDLGERSNTILIQGVLPRSSARREFVLSVWRPELYTTTLLRDHLLAEGIVVAGKPKLGALSNRARQVVLHEWAIDSVIINTNKTSDNLSAENTLKVIAAEKRGPPGSAEKGISVEYELLSSMGVDTTGLFLVDGSGVSHYNLVSAEVLVQLLAELYKRREVFDLFYRSLPIGGVDGTLQNRMRGTAATGLVRAKTGSLTGVSTLSGYVNAQDGELLAFSILMEHFTGSTAPYRKAQDRIVELLARFNRSRSAKR